MIAGYRKVPGGKSRQQKAGYPAQAGDRRVGESLTPRARKDHRDYVDWFHPKGVIKTSEKRQPLSAATSESPAPLRAKKAFKNLRVI